MSTLELCRVRTIPSWLRQSSVQRGQKPSGEKGVFQTAAFQFKAHVRARGAKSVRHSGSGYSAMPRPFSFQPPEKETAARRNIPAHAPACARSIEGMKDRFCQFRLQQQIMHKRAGPLDIPGDKDSARCWNSRLARGGRRRSRLVSRVQSRAFAADI